MKNIFYYIIAFAIAVLSCNSRQDSAGNLQAELQHLASNPSEIWICAHRGNTYEGIQNGIPENSIAAIEKAITAGANIVEIDVRTTADGHFVLMHDITIDRTTNASGYVKDKTLSQLKTYKLRAANGTLTDCTIPTLEEALLAGRGKVFFDLDKTEDVNNKRKLVALVDSLHMLDCAIFYIGRSKEAGSDLKSSHAQSIACPMVHTISDLDYWSSDPELHLIHIVHQDVGADSLVNAARKKQIITFSNALDNAGDNAALQGDFSGIDKMKELQVQIIQTDYVEIIRNYLK